MLRRLFVSRFEGAQIAEAARGFQTIKNLDFDAARETILKKEIGFFNVLHFAAHAILDEQQPELSAIALSMFDKNNRSVNGWLRSSDVLNCDLHTDLVFLGSCRSAVGKRVKGGLSKISVS